MFKKKPLASAVSTMSIASALVASGITAPVYAQDVSNATIEEVVVTGSRIRRPDIDSASPVTVLDRSDIVLTGLTDVGDILQSMPSMSGSPIGTTTNNGGNGSVQIDLRGMGVDRTLTLVNGQRTVDGGDFQTIPASMIERVEILKDGASATYGADAVAGVVNIITRKDFEGFEVYTQTAEWMDSEGGQDSVGFVTGNTFDGGHFVFGAEFVDQEEAFQRDVPWDFMQNSYYIYPEGCENQVAAPYDGTPQGGCYPIGSSRIPEGRFGFISDPDGDNLLFIGTPASSPYEVGLLEPYDGRTYNYAPVNYLQTPYERTNVFVEGSFAVSDNVNFRTEIRGNKRTSAQELAPLPFTPGDPMYVGNFMGQAYEGISENNYYLRRAIDLYNTTNGASLPYEPVSDARRRMIETSRRFEQNINQYQFLAELEGDLNDTRWSVYINEGYRQRQDRDFGQFSGVRLSNALGPSADLDNNGQPECYTNTADPTTLIQGCVPLNLFGGGVVDAGSNPTVTTLTQDMLDYVSLDTVDTFITRQTVFGASLDGTSIIELPGGGLGWAVGYTYWDQEYEYTPDSAKTIGAVTGNVGAGTDGTLTNKSVFAELFAPVFDNGTQRLDLKLGLRYDDYDAFDSESTWQLGAEFNLIENVKLRATSGTVFRAPDIDDLYGGLVDSFPTYTDPCIPAGGAPLPATCAQVGIQNDSQVNAKVGGNPNLQPETGDSFTAGVVWTPTFGNHDLSLTVDYWDIQIEEGISSLGVQFILDDCYLAGNQQSCDLVTRAPNYSITSILDSSLNVADQGAKGIDTEVRWSLPSTDYGDWEVSFLWSHLTERTKTPFAGASKEDLSGRYTDPTAEDGGAYADDKFNYTVQWQMESLSIAYKGEFISSLDADTFCNCGTGNRPDGSYIQKVDSFLYHDLVARYEAPYGFTVSGAITNLTDEEPPFIEIGFNATTDPSTYRLFGRGYYVRLDWNFSN